MTRHLLTHLAGLLIILCPACVSNNAPTGQDSTPGPETDTHQNYGDPSQGDHAETAPGEESTPSVNRSLLYGTWKVTKAKYAPDANFTDWEYSETRITFKENGLYQADGYYGSVGGIYTIPGNDATINVLIDNVLYVTYEVVEQGLESMTICANYTSTPTPVWMVFEKSGNLDQYLEQPPVDVVSQETLFTTENNAQTVTAHLYSLLQTFLLQQLQAENSLLSGQGQEVLNPSSVTLERLISAGFSVVRTASTFLTPMQEMAESVSFDMQGYIAHVRVVRDMALYNMSMLWGGAILLEDGFQIPDDTYQWSQSLTLTPAQDVYDYVLTDLSQLPTLKDLGLHAFSEGTIFYLRAECALSRGRFQDAATYADQAAGTLTLPNNGLEEPIYVEAMKAVFAQEAARTLDGLDQRWQDGWAGRYGYWAALKRLGKAQDAAGCQAYQLLLPIPERWLQECPQLEQNPGYTR